MNLNKIGTRTDTTQVAIVDPLTNSPLYSDVSGKGEVPVTIEVYGSHTAEFRDAWFEASETYKADRRLLTCCVLSLITKSWQGIQENDADVELTAQNAFDIYNRYDWLAEQVEHGFGNKRNFFQR